MYLTIAVASICLVGLIFSLVTLACRHRGDLWITHDDAIMCVVSPAIILLLTFGGISVGFRITHGGLATIPVSGWIASAVLIGATIALRGVLARWLRRGGPDAAR
jgi:hypothetical protein